MKKTIFAVSLFASLLAGAATPEELVACPVSQNLRGHENIEWSIGYAFDLTSAQRTLPRALLVGDSICNGYQSAVRNELAGKMCVSYWVSSYCVTSPGYLRLLSFYLDEAEYAVIHFNNGLHSLGTPAADWEKGLRAALALIRAKQPKAKIVLCALFPRGADATSPYRETNAAINQAIQRFCDGKTIFWCDFSDRFLNPDGTLSAAMMPDYLHPKAPGYEIWAAAVKPFLNYALTAKEGDLPIPQLFRGSADPGAFLPGKPYETIPSARIAPMDASLKDGWLDRVEAHRGEILNAKGAFDVVFLGDSITHAWDAPQRGRPILDELRKTYSVLNLGYSGDCTQHLLWRFRFGELDNYKAQFFVLMIGTNNCADKRRENVVAGVKEILDEVAKRQPEAKVLLFSIFPRSQHAKDWARLQNEQVNEKIRAFADGQRVIWCDINAQLTNADGSIDPELMPDFLHPLTKGYEIWRDALLPHVKAACGK